MIEMTSDATMDNSRHENLVNDAHGSTSYRPSNSPTVTIRSLLYAISFVVWAFVGKDRGHISHHSHFTSRAESEIVSKLNQAFLSVNA